MESKRCERCGAEFKPYRTYQVYCTPVCKNRALALKRYRKKVSDPCSVEGCDRKARIVNMSAPLCQLHHERKIRWGHVGPPGLVRKPKRKKTPYTDLGEGRWLVADTGYVLKKGANGRGRYEHRVVMEEMLGRPLRPGETVHHKNGRRGDNWRANLELWFKGQPAGQRVEDLIAFVVEHYPEQVKAALEGRPQLF